MKVVFISMMICLSVSLSAQNNFYRLVDNFDSNRNRWTESISKKSKAVIQDGVLILESKSNKEYAKSTAHLGVSLENNFELSCKCLVKEIEEDDFFGLIFNEKDENNFCAFLVTEGEACLFEHNDKGWNLISKDRVKLSDKKNQEVLLSIKNNFSILTFYVNGMEAIKDIRGKINYSGFGFAVSGKQYAEFDDLIVIQ
jgi:hypothetical protein